MEVVGWSPSEEFQDSVVPPQAGGWSGVEDRDISLYASPSPFPLPNPPSPRFEPATVHQRRLKDPEHVRRPRNAFIIFRCDFTQKYLDSGGSERAFGTENVSLSKRAGEAWNNLKPETKQYYKLLADDERTRHRIDHPEYRFCPKRQKHVGGRRSPKKRVGNPGSKRSAGRSSSVSSVECNQVSQNDPLQTQTIPVPSSSTLLQSHPSRQATPDFFHGYGSTTPTSPCSPLSPTDDILYMPRPTIAASRSDSLLSYMTEDSRFYEYPKDPLAPFPDNFSLFEQTYTEADPASSFNYPPLAAVASSLAGWDGNGQGQEDGVNSLTPKPVLYQESDFANDPFISLPLADGAMGWMNMPFGSDPLSAQSDMDAYLMGLKEYGIPPACNQ